MYMNVKKGQLKEHIDLNCAVKEARRLANSLNCNIYTVESLGYIMPKPILPHNNSNPWTKTLDKELLYIFMNGVITPRELGVYFGRTAWAICCRLEKYKLQCSKDCMHRGY